MQDDLGSIVPAISPDPPAPPAPEPELVVRWNDLRALDRMLLEAAQDGYWRAPRKALRRLLGGEFVRLITTDPDARYRLTGRGRHLLATRYGGQLCPACNGRGHNEIDWSPDMDDEPFSYDCEACGGTGVLPEHPPLTWDEREALEREMYEDYRAEMRDHLTPAA